jgi:hypothetical protein
MTPDEPTDTGHRQFRLTLIRVLAVQVVALLLLWLLQSRYGVS